MSYESGLNYRTITVEKYDALLAVVEAAKIHVAARYCKIDALRDALDALDAAP